MRVKVWLAVEMPIEPQRPQGWGYKTIIVDAHDDVDAVMIAIGQLTREGYRLRAGAPTLCFPQPDPKP